MIQDTDPLDDLLSEPVNQDYQESPTEPTTDRSSPSSELPTSEMPFSGMPYTSPPPLTSEVPQKDSGGISSSPPEAQSSSASDVPFTSPSDYSPLTSKAPEVAPYQYSQPLDLISMEDDNIVPCKASPSPPLIRVDPPVEDTPSIIPLQPDAMPLQPEQLSSDSNTDPPIASEFGNDPSYIYATVNKPKRETPLDTLAGLQQATDMALSSGTSEPTKSEETSHEDPPF